MAFWLIRCIAIITTGITIEGVAGLNSHATLSGIHRSPSDDTKFNSFTASCKSDETALIFEFKWKRWNGDGWDFRFTNRHSYSRVYNWKENNSTGPSPYLPHSFGKLNNTGTNLKVKDVEPWELGMVGCHTKGGYKGNMKYAWVKITRDIEESTGHLSMSFDVKCTPYVPLQLGDSTETFLNMYEVENKITGSNKYFDCDDDGEKLRCTVYKLLTSPGSSSLDLTEKVGCVYKGAIQMSTLEDKEERGLQTYYPEGGMYNFRCYLKKAGTVEWTWGNPVDNSTHVLSRNNEAFATLPAEISDRYTFSLSSSEQQYITALTLKEAKPWESGTFGCRTVEDDGTVIQSESRDIKIAGEIKTTISPSLSLDGNGGIKVKPEMAFQVTCEATDASVAPVLSLSLGDNTYTAVQSQTTNSTLERIPELGMTEAIYQVTARYNVSSLTCNNQCDMLKCSASGPVSQTVTDGVMVTVEGCEPCEINSASPVSGVMGLVSMVTAACHLHLI